jgi:glycine/D-amino acid oxidase-like deaminating enzyme
MDDLISRRKFLGRAAAAGLGIWALGNGAFSCGAEPHVITGKLLGPDFANGHRLRKPLSEAKVSRFLRTEIVIVGGGVAGLACAWQLQQRGFNDFLLLEMEAECGGNARSGSQNGMRHPWGAHYLPVPDAGNLPLMTFLQQHNVVTGFDRSNRPIFNELYLCHAPEERLQIHGVWQNGLVPNTGLSPEESAQIHRFFEEIEVWKKTLGNDGIHHPRRGEFPRPRNIASGQDYHGAIFTRKTI